MIVACFALTVLPGARAYAQEAACYPDGTIVCVADDVRPGEKVFVTDVNGVQSQGRILRVSPSELTLLIAGKEQTVSSARLGRLEKGDSLWNGVLMGAAPFALFAGAAVGASCSPHCGRDISIGMLVYGAVGAGVGALVDLGHRGYSIVDGPPLASANARRSPPPVTLLDDLWLRIRQGDTIRVVTRNGQTIAGKFVQVSNTSVRLAVEGTPRDIPSGTCRA